jgi:predicted nucleic acid-binding protein
MDVKKKKIATELIQEKFFGWSAQVAQEFYAVATRKADFKISDDTALEWLENLDVFPCQTIDVDLVKNAIVISARYRLSYWDSAILAAAEALGAPVVYSEDFNHGQSYGDIKVCNPFADLPQSGFHEEASQFRNDPAGRSARPNYRN